MEKPKIYLETTMFNFYYEKRTAPPYLELKAEVHRIFELIKAGNYEPYTSIFATNEIDDTEDQEKRTKMWNLISDYGVTVLEVTPEADRLTALYIQEDVVSPAWATDAAHIAMTTVNGLDFIVSLNFTHIARPWTIEHVRRVNMREGYNPIGIYKPAEVLEIYEEGTGIHE
ncbi:MAG: hypothetical protein LBB98_06260 [Treponema sp.]|jgi:hypothetical protein|nr:hypothetical protein [Treponema sp.]